MNRMILRNTAVLLVTAILLVTPTMALADGGGDGYVVTANGYQVELVFKEPAAIGENEFHIQITDSMGMPVPNAEVEVSCLPAEGMSTHEETVSAELHNTQIVWATWICQPKPQSLTAWVEWICLQKPHPLA